MIPAILHSCKYFWKQDCIIFQYKGICSGQEQEVGLSEMQTLESTKWPFLLLNCS